MPAKTSCKIKNFDKYIAKFSIILKIFEFKLKITNFCAPAVNLGIRLWMADVFWKSAILKMPKDFLWVGKGDWSSTLFLFEYEHPVPGVSPSFAALMGTSFEFICPILLVLGLGTRPAAAILLIMTAFIQITYQQHITHIYWMILLAVLIFQGAGNLSLDYLIRKKALSCKEYRKAAGID